jgi:tripartite-type tricarboxylate transporter receptor subunit TctC
MTRARAHSGFSLHGLERIKTLGYDLIVSTPADFAAQLMRDVERWRAVVEHANVKTN